MIESDNKEAFQEYLLDVKSRVEKQIKWLNDGKQLGKDAKRKFIQKVRLLCEHGFVLIGKIPNLTIDFVGANKLVGRQDGPTCAILFTDDNMIVLNPQDGGIGFTPIVPFLSLEQIIVMNHDVLEKGEKPVVPLFIPHCDLYYPEGMLFSDKVEEEEYGFTKREILEIKRCMDRSFRFYSPMLVRHLLKNGGTEEPTVVGFCLNSDQADPTMIIMDVLTFYTKNLSRITTPTNKKPAPQTIGLSESIPKI